MASKTKSGFTYTLDKDILDDWELVERLSSLDDLEDPKEMIGLIKDILGPDQYTALKEHLRAKEGRVRTTSMTREVGEIMAGAAELKK